MAAEQSKKGLIERGANFFEKLHYAIGAVAIAGAVAFESGTLALIGAWEIAHGALWNIIKDRAGKKPKATLAPT